MVYSFAYYLFSEYHAGDQATTYMLQVPISVTTYLLRQQKLSHAYYLPSYLLCVLIWLKA